MKKRLMALLVCVLLLVMVIPGIANAQGNDAAPALTSVRYSGAEFRVLVRMVATANRQIEIAVKFAQLTPWNDISWLQNFVDGITAPVFAYAKAIGAVVVCEYTTYYIDGQYVLVDPLRVIPL